MVVFLSIGAQVSHVHFNTLIHLPSEHTEAKHESLFCCLSGASAKNFTQLISTQFLFEAPNAQVLAMHNTKMIHCP
jgi:hypothetical protein